MSTAAPDSEAIAAEARALLARFRTLLMATASAEGAPDASYAPFVRREDDCFYVYLSGLSRHTANLEASGRASVLFIEDERDARQPFARRRLSFDCRAELLARDQPEWRAAMGSFREAFGSVIDQIRPLTDFRLFRLRPQGGLYVRGFGQAYRVRDAALADIEHIRAASGATGPA